MFNKKNSFPILFLSPCLRLACRRVQKKYNFMAPFNVIAKDSLFHPKMYTII